ncbi:MAG: hypothetical protein K9H26_11635 [Prolixibacteraceae bacterium]|nr:hypothetical protein [Prolixibacteraceae bacterium]
MEKLIAKIVIVLTGLAVFTSCFEEFDYVPEMNHEDALFFINGQKNLYDTATGLMLFPVSGWGHFSANLSFNQLSELYVDGRKISNHEEFNFGAIGSESTFIVETTNNEGLTKTFNLKFTLLPVVKVTHRYAKIPDEPKIISTFCLICPGERQSVYRYAEIEVRGGSTKDHPKKSFGFTLVDENDLKKEVPLSLLGMPPASDWILNSGYIENFITKRIEFLDKYFNDL